MPISMVGCIKVNTSAKEIVSNEIVNIDGNKTIKYGNLKIRVPEIWDKSSITDGMEVYKEVGKETTFSIIKSDCEIYMVDEYFNKIEDYLKNNVKSSDINSERFKVNRADALKVKYKYSVNNGDEAMVYQVHIIKNGEVYILTMLTKEDNAELEFNIMDYIVKSIRI